MECQWVTFTQDHTYFVEGAKDENEAKKMGYRQFCDDMTTPIADTHYDDVSVELTDDEEE